MSAERVSRPRRFPVGNMDRWGTQAISRWLAVFSLDGTRTMLPMLLVETPNGRMLRAEDAAWGRTEVLSPLAHVYRDEEGLDLVGLVEMKLNAMSVTAGAHFSLWLPVVTGFAEFTTIPTVRRPRKR